MVEKRETTLRRELVKARVEILQLRESLKAILEEAEGDYDRDIILTESHTALRRKGEAWRW